jgi:hypothetical protein
MIVNQNYRSANVDDSPFMAEMIDVSSGGLAPVEWTNEAQMADVRSALDTGAEMYAIEDGDYSYKNCWIAEATMRQPLCCLVSRYVQGIHPIACCHLLTGPMYLLLTSTCRRLMHAIPPALPYFEDTAGKVSARNSCGLLGNSFWQGYSRLSLVVIRRRPLRYVFINDSDTILLMLPR